MLLYYFIFFWFLSNLSDIISFNIKDSNFNLFNEFFFCLDSFSTTFIIFYLVLFFLIFDLILIKFFNISLKVNYSFFFLKFKFFFFIFTKLFKTFVLFLIKYATILYFKVLLTLTKLTKIFGIYFNKSTYILWRPLFKRWSYFGLWSKKNNKN